MVTVALIGVLMAIAIPSYQQWRNKVRSRQAAQEIAAMATAIKQYYLDARAYPADLSAVGLSGRLDPWGHAYVYYNVAGGNVGGARKDHALNPINSDFDLYSKGADNDTQSQVTNSASLDDVIRARDGGYIGLASEFN